ncbi:MAG: hypothetical protein MJK13_03195 [Pseudomonadales bacterium]|nr:hypothetical protein [Pseudomonadales bacterium]
MMQQVTQCCVVNADAGFSPRQQGFTEQSWRFSTGRPISSVEARFWQCLFNKGALHLLASPTAYS